MIIVCFGLCEYLWENRLVLQDRVVSVKGLNVKAGVVFYQ